MESCKTMINLFIVLMVVMNAVECKPQIKVKFTEPYEIICKLDKLTQNIKWLYNETIIFDCNAPYIAGRCTIIEPNLFDYRAYNVDTVSNTISIKLTSGDIQTFKDEEAVWQCRHGDGEDRYTFNSVESPIISNLSISSHNDAADNVFNEGDTTVLNCSVDSPEPNTDKITWSSSRKGELSSDASLLTIKAQCTDNIDTYTCSVDNGVSFPVSQCMNITVKCETRVLHDEMNTTVSVRLGDDAILSLVYTGNEIPDSINWYRSMGSDVVKSDMVTNYRTKQTSPLHSHFINLIIYSVQKQDVGTYEVQLDYTATTSLKVKFTLNLLSDPIDNDPPFNGYYGIGIGAGGVILLIGLILVVVCPIKRVCNKDGDYLTPVHPTPSLSDLATLPPAKKGVRPYAAFTEEYGGGSAGSNVTSGIQESEYENHDYVNDMFTESH